MIINKRYLVVLFLILLLGVNFEVISKDINSVDNYLLNTIAYLVNYIKYNVKLKE